MRMRSQYAPLLTSSAMLAMVTTAFFASSVIVARLAISLWSGSRALRCGSGRGSLEQTTTFRNGSELLNAALH